MSVIASYLHNFIFIKTRKTGGTAVEVALGEICGPEDIVTPLGPHDEMVRGNGKPVCRNFTFDPALEQAMMDAIIRDDRPAAVRARRQCEFYSHMPAEEIKSLLDLVFWQKSYKFTVERHPYERAVSAAYYSYQPWKYSSFEKYLEKFIPRGHYTARQFYTINGVPVVDEFLRHESLHEDFKRLGERLGFPVPNELRQMKTKKRKDRRPATEILTNEQKAIIYCFCKPEFDLLGYST